MKDSFADLLLQLRGRADLSQEKLGKEINVHRNTIAYLENGTRRPGSRGLVLRLANALSCTRDEKKELLQKAGFSVANWPVEIWWNVPSRDSSFTGREQVLQNLHQLLKLDNVAMRTLSLSGMAGVGKTYTTIEYIYRFQQDYEIVLWLPANSWEVLTLACKKLAAELGLPKLEEADQVLVEVRRWLSRQHHWLLILDDLKDSQLLAQILPTNHHGSVLVTTRIPDTGPLAPTQTLSPMTEEDGTLFLLRCAKKIAVHVGLNQANPAQREQAQQICRFLDGLPLALAQAGAYIRATGCSSSDYLELYTKQRQKLRQWEEKHSSKEHPSVAATFLLTLDQVSHESQAAADLLRIFAFFAPRAIPEEIITQGMQALGPLLGSATSDQLLLNEAIEVLLRSSLVLRDAEERTFSVHQLIQATIQDSMEPEMIQKWAEKAVDAFSQMYINTIESIEKAEAQDALLIQMYRSFTLTLSKDAPLRLQRYLPHASICFDLIERWKMKQFQPCMMLIYVAADLKRCGYNSQARSFFSKSLKILESLYENDLFFLGKIRSSIGRLYLDTDQFEEAESFFQQALSIQKMHQGPTHPTVADYLVNLAFLYNLRGKYEISEKFYKEALDICQRAPQLDTSVLGECLQGLAHSYIYQKKYHDAEALLIRALEILQSGGAKETTLMVTYLEDLAKLYCLQDKYIQAEIFSRRALTIQEEYLGINHPSITESLSTLALVYDYQGKYDDAKSLYMRMLGFYQKNGEEESLNAALLFNNLATCYIHQRKFAEAEQFLQRTLEILEQKLGFTHPHTIGCLSNLVEVYDQMGEKNKAIQLLQQIISLFPPDDPSVINYIVHLAQSHLSQTEWDEAKELYEEALSLFEKHMNSDRSLLATIYNGLGLVYLFQRRYVDAEYYFEQALTLNRETHGPKSLDTALCLENLVELYNRQGWSVKALPLCEQALAIYEECEGLESKRTATCLFNLARIYRDQMNFSHAELLYQSALEIRQKALGAEHKDVAACFVCLAEIYTKQEKYIRAIEAYQSAKKILKQTLLSSDSQIIEIDLDLADICLAQGHQEEAEKRYTRALEILRQTRIPDYLEIASALNRLAGLYFELLRYDEAEPCYLQAIGILEHHAKDHETDLAISHHNLAILYSKQGKDELAKAHLLHTLEVIKVNGNAQNLLSARIKENLAAIYYEEGRYEQAEVLYQEALSIYRETIGFNHPEIILCLSNAAILNEKLGRHQEALGLYQKAIVILEQNPLLKQIDGITQIFENLALLHIDFEQMEDAEQVWKKALARRIQQDLDLDLNDDLEPFDEATQQALALGERQDRREFKEMENSLRKLIRALIPAVEAYARGDYTQSQKIETALFYLSAKGFPILQPTSEDERSSMLPRIPMGKIEIDMDLINFLQEHLKVFIGIL